MTGLIVHEWLGKSGGSERVVDAMLEAYPAADLVALWNDAPEKYSNVHESWLARTPLRHHKALALPLLPLVWRRLLPPTDAIDWVLVSSHLFAHHVKVRTRSGATVPKYVYVHTPARYIWEPELDMRGNSILARTASAALRPIDRRRASEPKAIAANSEFVRERVTRTWHRNDAIVIYPPVDVERIQAVGDWGQRLGPAEGDLESSLPVTFLLGASRFVPYKQLDVVIRVAAALDCPAVIAGSGPEEEHLRSVAEETGAEVHFILKPSTELLYTLYQRCAAYIFPAIEDFGIMPVEAIAAGARVVVGPVGGAAESVRKTGYGMVAVDDSIDGFCEATRLSMEMIPAIGSDVETLFGKNRFINQIRNWMDEGSDK
ncbi:glycosyl transferase [Acidipropionibacterium jensenii]|uniref:glycosyltransferase n=1 Tax=Acidipropionibacterium jensenii TaxID=1749 RepID=UPI000BC2EC14|nr:glycosyltransferase [Acidipropionibacterium jensenii]AZZ41377.1 glycosyl transferase [Acidipropionibacterium jensenii]